MKTKIIGREYRLERHTYPPSAASVCWEHWKQADLSRLSFKSFMSVSFEASPISHTSAIQSSSTPSLSLSDEPPRACDPAPAVPGGWHHRVDPSQEVAQSPGATSCLADPAFAMPHPDVSHHWDLTEPCHTTHVLHLMHCRRLEEWGEMNTKRNNNNKKKGTNISSELESTVCSALHYHVAFLHQLHSLTATTHRQPNDRLHS